MNNKRYNYKEIMQAKEILGIPSFASREYIKKKYKEMVKKYHPDGNTAENIDTTAIQKINDAYKIIENYMDNYEYSFEKDAISRYNPEMGSSFADYVDPFWGNK
ncbi:MAG: DnaJ domain-containing protein [Candidatus Goldbacteria bacterium]|nr:DnaJ domain-containing protein [Candidatus Goldiibacteriota bacterium]